MFYIKIDGHIIAECNSFSQARRLQLDLKQQIINDYRKKKKRIPYERVNLIRIHTYGINPV